MVGSRGWFDRPDDAAPGAVLKVFVDGGYRCAMRGERDGQVKTSGFLFYERAELADVLVRAWRADRRVTCHAIGNLGIETAVDAITDAVAREPAGRGRVRIDHAIFLTADLIVRIADLGVPMVAQPSFLYDQGGVSPFPGIRLRPFRATRDAGISQAFSSDFPCGSLAPLLGVGAAVTRRSRHGDVADADEALSGLRRAGGLYLGGRAGGGIRRPRLSCRGLARRLRHPVRRSDGVSAGGARRPPHRRDLGRRQRASSRATLTRPRVTFARRRQHFVGRP